VSLRSTLVPLRVLCFWTLQRTVNCMCSARGAGVHNVLQLHTPDYAMLSVVKVLLGSQIHAKCAFTATAVEHLML
jgi:hypothetical protein